MKNVEKCDTWCELQNPVNHRVFEHKLHPSPPGQGHACQDITRTSCFGARPMPDTKTGPRCLVARRPVPALPRVRGLYAARTNLCRLCTGHTTPPASCAASCAGRTGGRTP
ncbi:hypothetical protein IHE45_15G046800 [Dioscorea alata]|uniref:Uncharacterized protein n=1 Tax=Dioscorea alata TaxID=55571 RepID=A0ACB7UL92_DIOAL|nr:hypothetical protein IHE45_15G046800 [Dioscorea alata]